MTETLFSHTETHQCPAHQNHTACPVPEFSDLPQTQQSTLTPRHPQDAVNDALGTVMIRLSRAARAKLAAGQCESARQLENGAHLLRRITESTLFSAVAVPYSDQTKTVARTALELTIAEMRPQKDRVQPFLMARALLA